MKITTLHQHSKVGIITNSSSEIFIYLDPHSFEDLVNYFGAELRVVSDFKDKEALFKELLPYMNLTDWFKFLELFNIPFVEKELRELYHDVDYKEAGTPFLDSISFRPEFIQRIVELCNSKVFLVSEDENANIDSDKYKDLNFVWWHLG